MGNRAEHINLLIRYCGNSLAKTEKGKTLPLWIHFLDAIVVMEMLWEKWIPDFLKEDLILKVGTETKVKAYLCFISGLHDIGKHTYAFQVQIRQSKEPEDEKKTKGSKKKMKKSPHHSLMGDGIARQIKLPETIASFIGAHHGVIQKKSEANSVLKGRCEDVYGPGSAKDSKRRQVLEKDWQGISQSLAFLCGYDLQSDDPELTAEEMLIINGLVILADWISSNTLYFPLEDGGTEFSAQWYKTRIDRFKSTFTFPKRPSKPKNISGIENFQKRFQFSPTDMQCKALEIAEKMKGEGLMIIEAGMGSGKTEAALGAADICNYYRNTTGLFFGLPTQATANGLLERLVSWANSFPSGTSMSFRLAHGNSWINSKYSRLPHISKEPILVEEEEKLAVYDWLIGRKRALLSDIVLGTVDQILLMGAKIKHVGLYHLGAAGKTVILDEIHSYDTYTLEFIKSTLHWLGVIKTPVILLSATLPKVRLQELTQAYIEGYGTATEGEKGFSDHREKDVPDGYPRITWTEKDSIHYEILPLPPSRKVSIQFADEGDESKIIVENFKNKLQFGGVAGVMVNTVRKAQRLYSDICSSFPDAEVLLFHSRFTDSDRERIEKRVMAIAGKGVTLEKGKKYILVSTQTLEQSLDISCDYLITELSPIDSLLQRLGRLHRFDRPDRSDLLQNAECLIIGWNFDAHNGVYFPHLLNQTYKVLMDRKEILIPRDIQELIENVYQSNTVSSEEKIWEAQYSKECALNSEKSVDCLLPAPSCIKSLDALSINYLKSVLSKKSIVRDIRNSVDVLLVQKKANSESFDLFLPGDPDFKIEECKLTGGDFIRKMMAQRVTLPYEYSAITDSSLKEELRVHKEHIEDVWKELAQLNIFKNEQFLLLNAEGEVTIFGAKLAYSRKIGLYRKGEN